MSVLLKLIFRELLVFALPISLLVVYVYHFSQFASGSLVIFTKAITWFAILGYHYLMHPNRIYTFRSAGYPVRRVLLYACSLDLLFILILILLFHAIS